ncbi:MAG: hypothetical protein JSU65_06840 [Candidatus Zixiibacteriota bacterium]|nr:MAG: hypothetical protein JSU65_06840 [candidate division Zixibacteria bacterium]
MVIATRLLDVLSALAILIAGIYVEVTFAELFSAAWKVVIAAIVLAHVSMQTHHVLAGLVHRTD